MEVELFLIGRDGKEITRGKISEFRTVLFINEQLHERATKKLYEKRPQRLHITIEVVE